MRRLTTHALEIEEIMRQILRCQRRCGAVVSFLGVVREDAPASRRVRALIYEAYEEMAEAQLQHLIDETARRWPIERVQVEHRLGRVEAGDVSVLVLVAAAHRAEAYAASQFLLEGLKRDVPIWKREVYDDGTMRWSDGCASVEEGSHAHV